MQQLSVERFWSWAFARPAFGQQAVVFRNLVAANETRRVVTIRVFHQLFVNLNLFRRRDPMILSVEVRLRGTFLVAVSPDVFGFKNVAVFVDDEPGFVRSPRRPDDLWLMSLRIEIAVVEHVEFDKRTAESDAAG